MGRSKTRTPTVPTQQFGGSNEKEKRRSRVMLINIPIVVLIVIPVMLILIPVLNYRITKYQEAVK